MSMRERTGVRDLTYSRWHRPNSTARFIGQVRAAKLTAIDVDWCEACCWCSTPLALIETQESGRTKSAQITKALGFMAGLPVHTAGYTVNDDRTDISRFVTRQLWPEITNETILSPQDYAEWLESLRLEHFALRAINRGACAPTPWGA